DGVCGFQPKDCDDGLVCTRDGCEDGFCFHLYDSTRPCTECDTNQGCVSADPCDQAKCVACPVADGTTLDRFDCPPSGKVCFVKACPDCNDGDPCTNDRCDAEGVVSNTDKLCTDYNPCTSDSCDPVTGTCIYEPVGGNCVVCTLGDDSVCNLPENNPSPNCLPGKCVEVRLEGGTIPCSEPGNPCPGGLRCDPGLGVCMTNICEYGQKRCEDGNACTKDECIEAEGGCVSECICSFGCTTTASPSLECNDGDPCTIDSCIEAEGVCAGVGTRFCYNEPVDCDDDNDQTMDYCEMADGTCVHLPRSLECTEDATCQADGNQCTTDEYCDGTTGKCLFREIDCYDRDPCTLDHCDPAVGCVNTPILGCDTVACTTSMQCNDGNDCTVDSCEPEPFGGEGKVCKHRDVVCEDAPRCYTGQCVDGTGCVYFQVPDCACAAHSDCMGEDLCTVGRCNFRTGQCFYQPKACDDGDACTLDT
ncbi:MAG TPA: hypothetical protein PK313_13545, partial [Myxococcota bacterium]|nr:hypothetical protein [Myxococcota bacterium]